MKESKESTGKLGEKGKLGAYCNPGEPGEPGIEGKEIKDLITPTLNKILIELITESEEHIKGVKRLNKGVEIYVKIHQVGNSVTSCKAGDFALTRPQMTFSTFKLYGKDFSIISEHDLIVVLDPNIISEFSTDKLKEISSNLELN